MPRLADGIVKSSGLVTLPQIKAKDRILAMQNVLAMSCMESSSSYFVKSKQSNVRVGVL